MKFIVVGGHLTPAIAFIQYVRDKGDQVLFLGRTYASEDKTIVSREREEVEHLGFEFAEISTVKFNRYKKFTSLLKSPLIIKTILQSLLAIDKFKPDAVISFGGYLSVPVALAAAIRRVPLVIHEQTVAAGLANRLLSGQATVIAVSFPSSLGLFPVHKTHLTGNLLRQEFYQDTNKPASLPEIKTPFIYITGGNQGSDFINRRVLELYPQLKQKYFLVHQTGSGERGEILSPNYRNHNLVRPWFTAAEVSWLLSHAFAVIGRSGANIVSEIALKGVPAIFIPLPGTQKDEQTTNARELAAKGTALVISQQAATPKAIAEAVATVETKREQMVDDAKRFQAELPSRPAADFYQLIHQSIVS